MPLMSVREANQVLFLLKHSLVLSEANLVSFGRIFIFDVDMARIVKYKWDATLLEIKTTTESNTSQQAKTS